MSQEIFYANKKLKKEDKLINCWQPFEGATGVAEGSRTLAEKCQLENPQKRYIVEEERNWWSPWTGKPAGRYTRFTVYEEGNGEQK